MLNSPISVLLATDFPILRDALQSIIESAEDLKWLGCVEKPEALDSLGKQKPDLVILDAAFASGSLLPVIAKFREQETKVLLMGGEEDKDQTIEALLHGLNGVIGRKSTPDLICRCIRAVATGEIWVSRQLTSALIDSLRTGTADTSSVNQTVARMFQGDRKEPNPASEQNKFGLTKRELQIIGALIEGQTNKDIASTFGLSEYTVKHHLTNVFDKLGVYNRVELVLFAISHQLCPEPTPTNRDRTAPPAPNPPAKRRSSS